MLLPDRASPSQRGTRGYRFRGKCSCLPKLVDVLRRISKEHFLRAWFRILKIICSLVWQCLELPLSDDFYFSLWGWRGRARSPAMISTAPLLPLLLFLLLFSSLLLLELLQLPPLAFSLFCAITESRRFGKIIVIAVATLSISVVLLLSLLQLFLFDIILYVATCKLLLL